MLIEDFISLIENVSKSFKLTLKTSKLKGKILEKSLSISNETGIKLHTNPGPLP